MRNHSTFDLAQVRADTPASARLIHFNNAGAALMPNAVSDAIFSHLDLERRIGGYEAETVAQPAINDFYDAFAELLNCDRGEIAYVENATRAWDMAFYALPLRAGDRILTHDSEYASNYLALLQLAKRLDVGIDVVPSDAHGQIDVEALRRAISSESRVIALTHAPTHNGLINPAAEVGRIAREHGLIYVLDACQSAGQLPLDVKKIGCHVLSGTGRKFLRGPRGTGFLYVEQSLLQMLDPPFIDMHAARALPSASFELRSDARRFETWESYVAGRLGLRAAVRYLLSLGVDTVSTRVVSLAASLRDALRAEQRVTVHDRGAAKSGIVTFTLADEQAPATAARLRAAGANVSVTVPDAAPLDLHLRRLQGAVRASVHYYNTTEEIAHFVKLVVSG
ncbi:MAG: aminotransferase class V-fold PLP-dependent enzyme [Pseudomonadota bacterium]